VLALYTGFFKNFKLRYQPSSGRLGETSVKLINHIEITRFTDKR